LRSGRLIIAPSCSLIHVPNSLETEGKMDRELKSWLAFAQEKLSETVTLAKVLNVEASRTVLEDNQGAVGNRRHNPRIHDEKVKARTELALDSQRTTPYPERRRKQQARLQLPFFATTTIGSFPQTGKVRAVRARLKRGELNP